MDKQAVVPDQKNNQTPKSALAISTPTTPTSSGCRTPVEGVRVAYGDFLSFLYQPHGRFYDDNARLFEKRTGLKREQGVYFLGCILALYLIIGRSAEFVCNMISYAYPVYKSVQAIKSHEKEDDTHWLIYWTVFATYSIFDFFAQSICSWFPPYWLFKASFLVYLYLPQTEGAAYMYEKVIEPLYMTVNSYLQCKHK